MSTVLIVCLVIFILLYGVDGLRRLIKGIFDKIFGIFTK